MNFFFKNIYDPKVLGWLGLAPFILILALFFFEDSYKELAQELFLTYAAIILTFLGAVHWGVLISNEKGKSIFYLWSISTSLIAWSGLLIYIFFNNFYLSNFIMLMGFSIALIIDLRSFSWVEWYKRLRLYLSTVVIFCIIFLFFR